MLHQDRVFSSQDEDAPLLVAAGLRSLPTWRCFRISLHLSGKDVMSVALPIVGLPGFTSQEGTGESGRRRKLRGSFLYP